MTVETCDNCGRTIGKLETAHVWNSHVLCDECSARLQPPTLDYANPNQAATSDKAPAVPDAQLVQVVMELRADAERSRYSGRRSLGALIFIIGLILLIFLPPIGVVLLVLGIVIWAAGVRIA